MLDQISHDSYEKYICTTWHTKVVFSDNGPQYSSHEFKKFSKSWEFIHKNSRPEFPQSNRFVERAIQTIKETLQKCREDNSDPY